MADTPRRRGRPVGSGRGLTARFPGVKLNPQLKQAIEEWCEANGYQYGPVSRYLWAQLLAGEIPPPPKN